MSATTEPKSPLAEAVVSLERLVEELRVEYGQPDTTPRPKFTLIQGGRDAR